MPLPSYPRTPSDAKTNTSGGEVLLWTAHDLTKWVGKRLRLGAGNVDWTLHKCSAIRSSSLLVRSEVVGTWRCHRILRAVLV